MYLATLITLISRVSDEELETWDWGLVKGNVATAYTPDEG